MAGDLDVNLSDVLVEDDASRILETLEPKQLKPKYMKNSLAQNANGMNSDDVKAADSMLSPRRPGFLETIQSILK